MMADKRSRCYVIWTGVLVCLWYKHDHITPTQQSWGGINIPWPGLSTHSHQRNCLISPSNKEPNCPVLPTFRDSCVNITINEWNHGCSCMQGYRLTLCDCHVVIFYYVHKHSKHFFVSIGCVFFYFLEIAMHKHGLLCLNGCCFGSAFSYGDLTDPNLNEKSCKYPFGKLDLVFQV